MNGNPPLNDCLYSGPSLLPSFADVLMRFRFHKVALVADIEKAFLMVSISPSDRDALRFIWLDDVHKDNPKEVVYRFCRVRLWSNVKHISSELHDKTAPPEIRK